MIPKITASTIYSTLGNNNSLIPLGIKDVANSCGLTTASYLAGEKLEGKDRFIDEFGTQAIWLGGLPTFKYFLGKFLCAPKGFDPNIDARILKNKEILAAAQEFAPTEQIKNSIKLVAKNSKAYKGITLAKFVGATVLTALSYFGLTKFRHKYTENQIKKEYIEKLNNRQKASDITFSSSFSQVHKPQNTTNISFTGLQDFMFNPVKNLMIIDGVITGERLTHSRNPQDLMGYVIKEGSFWAFMYFAGSIISKHLEKMAEKKFGKSIDLDARVIESTQLKDSFANGNLKKHLAEFAAADTSDVDIYKFAINPKSDNLVIEMAKKSDIIELYEKTNFADTRKYIDLDDLRGIKSKLEKLLSQYEKSGQTLDEFFKQVRKLKRTSVLKNIGACIGALGIVSPAIMLLTRKLSSNSEYQVKKDVEAKLSQG